MELHDKLALKLLRLTEGQSVEAKNPDTENLN